MFFTFMHNTRYLGALDCERGRLIPIPGKLSSDHGDESDWKNNSIWFAQTHFQLLHSEAHEVFCLYLKEEDLLP